MSTQAVNDLHVLIIGAGITGLLLAQGLKKHNIKYSVFERECSASDYRPREWTMGVHWALPQLQSLLPEDIWLQTSTTQPDPEFVASATDTFSLYNGQTGELLKTLPSGGMRRFSRTKLRALISTGIDVEYGKTLNSISYGERGSGVIAHFTDGTSVNGDVLVGTDGPRSKTRDLIIEEGKSEANPAGFVLAVLRSKYTTAQALELRHHSPMTSVAFHPNGTYVAIFGHDFNSSNPSDWEFQIMHSSLPIDFQGNDVEKLRLLKSRAKEYVGIWKNVIEWIPEGVPVSFNKLLYWKTIPFDNRDGRVTLAGDAAHPMTPQRGQGLNHAICDVANLVEGLRKAREGEVGLNDAVARYDEEMVKRGGDEVQAALVNTRMIHDWNSLMQSALVSKSTAREK